MDSLVLSARAARATGGVNLDGLGLEIGPSHRPLIPKSSGLRIRSADHLDRDGLIAKYATHAGVDTSLIEDVDYVLVPGSISTQIDERFDYIIAAHMLEHTVSMLDFLNDCETLLNPGGVLVLILPDKRFCFDRLRERSTLARIIDVYDSKPLVHSRGTMADYFLNVVSRDGEIAWDSECEATACQPVHSLTDALEHMDRACSGEYVDVHNWVFTPCWFRLLVHDLRSLGMTGFTELSFTPTMEHEFYVCLTNAPDAKVDISRRELVLAAEAELDRRGGGPGPVSGSQSLLAGGRAEYGIAVELAEMKASRSWRMTAPLRRLAGTLRRGA